MKKEMSGQDQMNIVRAVVKEMEGEKIDINESVISQLDERGICYDIDLVEELADDCEYRFEHEQAVLEMDKIS